MTATYAITEEQLQTISNMNGSAKAIIETANKVRQRPLPATAAPSCPYWGTARVAGIDGDKNGWCCLKSVMKTATAAPDAPGSIRQQILQEDAYLIERVNAGMGEWEYVIQYCGEYFATAPTEDIARRIVKMTSDRGWDQGFQDGQTSAIQDMNVHEAAIVAAAREQWEKEQDPCAANGCTDTENCDEICEHMRIYSPAYVRKARADAAKAERERVMVEILDRSHGVFNLWDLQDKLRAEIKYLREQAGKDGEQG